MANSEYRKKQLREAKRKQRSCEKNKDMLQISVFLPKTLINEVKVNFPDSSYQEILHQALNGLLEEDIDNMDDSEDQYVEEYGFLHGEIIGVLEHVLSHAARMEPEKFEKAYLSFSDSFFKSTLADYARNLGYHFIL